MDDILGVESKEFKMKIMEIQDQCKIIGIDASERIQVCCGAIAYALCPRRCPRVQATVDSVLDKTLKQAEVLKQDIANKKSAYIDMCATVGRDPTPDLQSTGTTLRAVAKKFDALIAALKDEIDTQA